MTSENVTLRIENLDQIISRMEDPHVKEIASKHMRYGLALIEEPARINAAGVGPSGYGASGSGHGVNTITSVVVDGGNDMLGIVGSPLEYMAYQEYGTGLLYDGPGPKPGKAHYPPPAALETWCRRNGIASAWGVSRAIGRRGGLRPKRFLRKAWEQAKPGVTSEMGKILPEITRRMAGK